MRDNFKRSRCDNLKSNPRCSKATKKGGNRAARRNMKLNPKKEI